MKHLFMFFILFSLVVQIGSNRTEQTRKCEEIETENEEFKTSFCAKPGHLKHMTPQPLKLERLGFPTHESHFECMLWHLSRGRIQ